MAFAFSLLASFMPIFYRSPGVFYGRSVEMKLPTEITQDRSWQGILLRENGMLCLHGNGFAPSPKNHIFCCKGTQNCNFLSEACSGREEI
jgi:hypothetical protein